MSHTIEDIKHIMTSRDATVYFFKDGIITIENSLIEGGKREVSTAKAAKDVLRTIVAFGDQVPIGIFDELEKLC